MSLLSLVQQASALLSLPQPASVVNATDPNVRLLYGLANEEGDDLASGFNWQALTSQFLFTTQASQVQAAGLPPDLDRAIPNTAWNRSTNRPLIGPLSSQAWQRLLAFPSLSLPNIAYRTRGNQFLAYPTPPAGQVIAYEYVSENWAQTAAAQPAAGFTADTDTAMLDEGLMTLGLRWRFLKSKGLDYAEDFRAYEANKQQMQARDGGSTVLSLSGADEGLYSAMQVPEGGFPGR